MFRRCRGAAAALVIILAGLGSSEAFARPKRFIVKVASGQPAHGIFLQAVRTTNMGAVAREVDLNIPGSKTLFQAKKFGMLVVQNEFNEELLKDALSRHPYVKYYEEDVEFHLNSAETDANRCSLSNSGMQYCITDPSPSSYQYSPWFRDVLGMSLEDTAPDGEIEMADGEVPTTVAVIDTGTMVEHPYLKNAILANDAELSGSSSVDDDGNGVKDDIYGASFTLNSHDQLVASGDPSDDGTDHGSHVSGIIKGVRDHAISYFQGRNNMAPRRVQILPIRFINESQVGTTSGAIASLEYAASRGAKVVNCSWGAKGSAAYTDALYDAMVEAYLDHDMLMVIAAGNAEGYGANDNDKIPYFPSSLNVPSILSVASVSPEYRSGAQAGGSLYAIGLSSFSNYGGNSVHLAAPGGYRDKNGSSDGIYSANARLMDTGGAVYVRKKGTSMAAPVVAGIAGVVRALNPNLTSYEVKKLILDTVQKSNGLRGVVSSSGIADAASAFEMALVRTTNNEKPAVRGSPYYTYAGSSAQEGVSPRRTGGCGLLVPLGGDSDEGPFGGNSLLLFGALYLIAIFIRSMQRHIGRGRV